MTHSLGPCRPAFAVIRGSTRSWNLRASLALLACLVVFGACSSRRAVVYEAEYHLVEHLESARPSQERRLLSTSHFAIGHDERRVLVQGSPSGYVFPEVPSGPRASLHVAPTTNPKAWDQPGGSVGFEARCRAADGSWHQLLELTISPATVPADRKWHDRQISLEPCQAPATEIELLTSCGPGGRCAADLAAWGQPRVVHQSAFVPRAERLAILISIDTLRPDRLGLYGAERETSPELERLAEDGIVFETTIASSPWTIPSHASMLTSTYPRVHGADARTPIAETATSLVEALDAAGWQSAGFVDTPYLSRSFGFHRGFGHFDDEAAPSGDFRRGAPILRQRALDWLAATDERPAFLFWHIMDVHGPYRAAAPFGGRFRSESAQQELPDPRIEQLRDFAYHDYLNLDRFSSFEDLVATYDEGIAAADSSVGGLLRILREAGLYDDALIVVTSDHGESFLDHGVWVGHGLFLTDDELRVPLIVKLPGNRHAGKRVREMVGMVDVAPSVLDALGVESPASFQGRSLVSPVPAAPESLREAVYGFSNNTGASFLRTRNVKYIGPTTMTADKVLEVHLRRRDGVSPAFEIPAGEQLYHLRRDPNEASSIAEGSDSENLEPLRAMVARHTADCAARREGTPEAPAPEITAEEAERLRALGYVN